jgi:hypothetical protein
LCGSREARKKQQKTVAGDGPLAPPKQRAQKGLLLLQLPWLVKVARKRRKNQKICGSRATKRVGFCVKQMRLKIGFFFSMRAFTTRPDHCVKMILLPQRIKIDFFFSRRAFTTRSYHYEVFFSARNYYRSLT